MNENASTGLPLTNISTFTKSDSLYPIISYSNDAYPFVLDFNLS